MFSNLEEEDPPFVQKYGNAFETFCVPYFALLDYFSAAVQGLIAGAMLLPQTRKTCVIAAVFCLFISLARLFAILLLKPFRNRLDLIFGLFASIVETLSAILGLLAALRISLEFLESNLVFVATALSLVGVASAGTPRASKVIRVIAGSKRTIKTVISKIIGKHFAQKKKSKRNGEEKDKTQKKFSISELMIENNNNINNNNGNDDDEEMKETKSSSHKKSRSREMEQNLLGINSNKEIKKKKRIRGVDL